MSWYFKKTEGIFSIHPSHPSTLALTAVAKQRVVLLPPSVDALEGLLACYCDARAILYFLDEPLGGSTTTATVTCFIDTADITMCFLVVHRRLGLPIRA